MSTIAAASSIFSTPGVVRELRAENLRLQAENLRLQAFARSGALVITQTVADLRRMIEEVVEPAEEALANARVQIRVHWQTEVAEGNNQTLVAAYNAMSEAERILRDSSDSDDDFEDDALHCVLCGSSDADGRNFSIMVPEGRWATLAPGARTICSLCRRDEPGAIESGA